MIHNDSHQAINLLSNGGFTNYWAEPAYYTNSATPLVGRIERVDRVLYSNPGGTYTHKDPHGVLGHWRLSGEVRATVGSTHLSRDGGNVLELEISRLEETFNDGAHLEEAEATATSAAPSQAILTQTLTDPWGQADQMGFAFSAIQIKGTPTLVVNIKSATETLWSETFSANSFGSYRRVSRLLDGMQQATTVELRLEGALTDTIGLAGITLINGPSSRVINYVPSLADKFIPKGLVFMVQGDEPLQGFYPLAGDYMALIGPNPGEVYGSELHNHGDVPIVGLGSVVTRNLAAYHDYPPAIPNTPFDEEVPFVAASRFHTHNSPGDMVSLPKTQKILFCYKV